MCPCVCVWCVSVVLRFPLRQGHSPAVLPLLVCSLASSFSMLRSPSCRAHGSDTRSYPLPSLRSTAATLAVIVLFWFQLVRTHLHFCTCASCPPRLLSDSQTKRPIICTCALASPALRSHVSRVLRISLVSCLAEHVRGAPVPCDCGWTHGGGRQVCPR